MIAAVFGCGAVGARAARQLATTDTVDELLLYDTDPARSSTLARALGERARALDSDELRPGDADVAVLALPAGEHHGLAVRLLAARCDVVSTSDDWDEADNLLGLDALARHQGRVVVVGAAFSPGYSCLLARLAAHELDQVDEVHVARMGTGGPACAHAHHRALGSRAREWRDGAWTEHPGGSGRELCWFPEPAGAHDCYRADLAEPLLLRVLFPEASRVSSRLAGTRRDRLTARLPMLRKPHPEGATGAVRVEVRGRRRGAHVVRVVGASRAPAVAAGAMAAVAAVDLLVPEGDDRREPGARPVGAERWTVQLREAHRRGVVPFTFASQAAASA